MNLLFFTPETCYSNTNGGKAYFLLLYVSSLYDHTQCMNNAHFLSIYYFSSEKGGSNGNHVVHQQVLVFKQSAVFIFYSIKWTDSSLFWWMNQRARSLELWRLQMVLEELKQKQWRESLTPLGVYREDHCLWLWYNNIKHIHSQGVLHHPGGASWTTAPVACMLKSHVWASTESDLQGNLWWHFWPRRDILKIGAPLTSQMFAYIRSLPSTGPKLLPSSPS